MPVKGNSQQLARVGPVHFQPLEQELHQISQYFRGRLLDAGCGNRDISLIATKFGARDVTHYDLQSTIPGATLGPLSSTPFGDAEFDTILCNAVLEHVPDVDAVMRELVRILKPGGHLIAAVPYLQPMHRDPTDFRRYTRDGLEELGSLHGLHTAEILPLHTIWQSLGWIAWAWAKEKGGWRTKVTFPVVWIVTRMFNRTDTRLIDNANTYQAVFLKPGLREQAWPAR